MSEQCGGGQDLIRIASPHPARTAIRTSYPAEMVGSADGGRIAVGLKADLNMTDRDRLRLRVAGGLRPADRRSTQLAGATMPPSSWAKSPTGGRGHRRPAQLAPGGALKGSSPASAPARVHSQSTLTVALGLPIKHSLSPSPPSNSSSTNKRNAATSAARCAVPKRESSTPCERAIGSTGFWPDIRTATESGRPGRRAP